VGNWVGDSRFWRFGELLRQIDRHLVSPARIADLHRPASQWFSQNRLKNHAPINAKLDLLTNVVSTENTKVFLGSLCED
jgi:hypothetical protein